MCRFDPCVDRLTCPFDPPVDKTVTPKGFFVDEHLLEWVLFIVSSSRWERGGGREASRVEPTRRWPSDGGRSLDRLPYAENTL